MFDANQYRRMYDKFMGPLAQDVVLKVNNGTGFDSHSGVSAHVTNYRESDLIAGGSIKLGDLRLIILADNIPQSIDRLEQKDRIEIGGRDYAVLNWDSNTRSIGDQTIAVEVAVRG